VQPLDPLVTNLDRVLGTMKYVRRLRLGRPLVHIIDQEADSIAHFRAWCKAGHLWLARVQGRRAIKHRGQRCHLDDVVRWLRRRRAFTFSRPVLYHGRKAQQLVAEAEVVLYRSARPTRKASRRQPRKVPGVPLTLRLIVSEVRDAEGKLLAEWLLLTNVPAKVAAATLALWYYWRWRVESYYKLLKSAGQQVEHWQQETALALAKRLQVASMACVLVWQVGQSAHPEAERFRELLVRLSGRLVKRDQKWTCSALLAGLWVLLALLEVVEEYPVKQLRAWARKIPSAKRTRASRGSSGKHPTAHGPAP
jgi:hypothetical protein